MNQLQKIVPTKEEYERYDECFNKFSEYIQWINATKQYNASLSDEEREAILAVREYWNSYKEEDKLKVLALHKHHQTIGARPGNIKLWKSYIMEVVTLGKKLFDEIPKAENPKKEEIAKFVACRKKFIAYIKWINANKPYNKALSDDQRAAICSIRKYWTAYRKLNRTTIVGLRDEHEALRKISNNPTEWTAYLLEIDNLIRHLIPKDSHEHGDDCGCEHDHGHEHKHDVAPSLEKLGITPEELHTVNEQFTKEYEEEFGYKPSEQPSQQLSKEGIGNLLAQNYKFWLDRVPDKEEKDYDGTDKAKTMMCVTGMNSIMDQAKKENVVMEVLGQINKKDLDKVLQFVSEEDKEKAEEEIFGPKEPADTAEESLTEEPTEEPAEEPTEEPVEELAEEPTEEPVEEPAEEPVEEPVS